MRNGTRLSNWYREGGGREREREEREKRRAWEWRPVCETFIRRHSKDCLACVRVSLCACQRMEQATKQMLYAVNYLLPACTELSSGEVEIKDFSKSWFQWFRQWEQISWRWDSLLFPFGIWGTHITFATGTWNSRIFSTRLGGVASQVSQCDDPTSASMHIPYSISI